MLRAEHLAAGRTQLLLAVLGDISRITVEHLQRIEPDGFEGDLRTGATHGIKPSGLEVETDSRVYPILYRRCCHCPIICISLSAPSRNSASVPLFPSTTSIRE